MTSTTSVRIAKALALTATVAALVTPVAALASSPPTVRDGRSPDTLNAVYAAQTQVTDGRSPDTLDAASAAHQQLFVPTDGRSPDTLDAASSPQPVLSTPSSRFHWGDAGIGAGLASGLLTLLAATGALWMRRHPRHEIQTT